MMDSRDVQAEKIAAQFHATYEALAPAFGHHTQPETAMPWRHMPINHRQLMVATVRHLLDHGAINAGRLTR